MKNNRLFTKLLINNQIFILYMIFMPFFTMLSVFSFQKGSFLDAISWLMENPLASLLNYFIAFALIHIFLLFINGKFYFVVSGFIFTVLSILSYISYVKNELRGEPLTILDYRLIDEASNITEVLDQSFFIPIVILLIAFSFIILLIVIFTEIQSGRFVQYTAGILSLFLLLFSYFTSIETLAKLKVEIPADVSWNHEENGFLLATLVDSKFMKVPKPEGYSKKAIEDIFIKMKETQQQSKSPEEGIHPNIIFVMSESFWNPEVAESLEVNKEVLPNFKRLTKESIVGEIEVPGIGGGTANTEYEVLTGLTKDYIQNYTVPYNPYNAYINRPIRSLATIFSERKYYTTAIHTYHSWFYKRNTVYQHLGFDQYLSLETFGKMPKNDGLFTDDNEITTLILNEMRRTPNKDFIYATTMQGHGPYADMKPKDNGVRIGNDVSDSTKVNIENYLNNLYDIDQDLNKLVNSLKEVQEPTVLVYFGDHIPPFGNEAYKEVGFNVYADQGRRTPVLIWSNTVELDGEVDINANMLGAYVLELIGANEDLYMRYLNSYSKLSPFNDKKSTAYREFELLHYDIMHGEQFIYELVGRPRVNGDFTVGYPVEINDAIAREQGDSFVIDIIGSGIGWMSTVVFNDKEYEVKFSDGEKATIIVPVSDIILDSGIEMRLQVVDSREKIIAASNTLKFENIEMLLKNFNTNKELFYNGIELGGELNWELFSQHDDYTIVRVDLGLEEVGYFVENEERILKNQNADSIDAVNQSDIYSNGFLYLSIPNEDAAWDKKPSLDQIKQYFSTRNYKLFVYQVQKQF